MDKKVSLEVKTHFSVSDHVTWGVEHFPSALALLSQCLKILSCRNFRQECPTCDIWRSCVLVSWMIDKHYFVKIICQKGQILKALKAMVGEGKGHLTHVWV